MLPVVQSSALNFLADMIIRPDLPLVGRPCVHKRVLQYRLQSTIGPEHGSRRGSTIQLRSLSFGGLDSQVRAFPGLTDAGRVRLSTNNSLSINLRSNFYLNLTLWDNFDSRPPLTARKNELGLSSGIGWSF
jgi:hypothetical protein